MKDILGLHHVTAIAGDPQKNVDFYAGFLGLRLVKLTVNFDDPTTYHLYYGDASGTPGSIITFFSWPSAYAGRRGIGQAIVASFTIPQASLGYWVERCLEQHVKHVGPIRRFNESVLLVTDPDGLTVELVAHPRSDNRPAWDGGAVPAEHAIRGLHSATLLEDGFEFTAKLLRDTLGFTQVAAENSVYRFDVGDRGPGAFIDVKVAPDFWKGAIGIGTIHHIALRTSGDESQKEWHDLLTGMDLNVSPVIDRKYFHSLYFHEPGGVLFEIATDPPGFDVDEPKELMGQVLKLPLWLEPSRSEIEATLPPVQAPPFPRIR